MFIDIFYLIIPTGSSPQNNSTYGFAINYRDTTPSVYISIGDHLSMLFRKEPLSRTHSKLLNQEASVYALSHKHLNLCDFPHSRAFLSGPKLSVCESDLCNCSHITVPCPFQSFVNKQLNLLLVGA